MIDARGLTRIYRLGDTELRALDGIDLTVGTGEFVALMGASGSGKSTLMHTLGLLDRPDGGSYKLLGQETAQLSEDERAVLRSRTLGFVFQQFNLLPRTSALENVALPRLYHPDPLKPGEAEGLLKSVGLGDRMDHTPAQLSGGQQQRVAIARALLNRPKLLFADEPTGNLDSKSSLEIMELFKGLHTHGITVVLVTHEPDIAAHARRVITLKDGKILSDRGNGKARQAVPASRKAVAKALPVGAAEASWAARTARAWGGYLRQASRAMLANRLRTFLSMLGIMIGVMAVVAMLAIGAGVQKSMQQQLSSLGSNLLMLMPGANRQGGVMQSSGTVARFQAEDAKAIAKAVPDLELVGPEINGRCQLVADGKNWNSSLIGAAPEYAAMRNSAPVLGRFFTEEENQARARVAVIGVTAAKNLWGDVNPVGKFFKLNRISFQVIGVLPAKGSSGFRDEDDKVVIPQATAQHRVLGRDHVDMIAMQVRQGADMSATQDKILAFMRQRFKLSEWQEDTFSIFNMADIQAALTSTTKTISMFLVVVAGISLLVGGIGIMNILLVSVTERTREIGLRKALGARQADIMAQFLIEAIAISLLGGLAGLCLGVGIAEAVAVFVGWSVEITVFSVVLAVGFSAVIGIAAGAWPASQAAKLDPIASLRFE